MYPVLTRLQEFIEIGTYSITLATPILLYTLKIKTRPLYRCETYRHVYGTSTLKVTPTPQLFLLSGSPAFHVESLVKFYSSLPRYLEFF